jgi:hypothetical protein
LSGPDEIRGPAAKEMGNEFGFTDRLDYIFANGKIELVSTELIGNNQTGTQNTKVWASDHAGVVSTLEVGESSKYQEVALNEHNRFPLGFWDVVGLILGTSLIYLAALRVRLNSRLKN